MRRGFKRADKRYGAYFDELARCPGAKIHTGHDGVEFVSVPSDDCFRAIEKKTARENKSPEPRTCKCGERIPWIARYCMMCGVSLDSPGTELMIKLKRMNVKPDESCNCELHAAQMNTWGSEKCIQNIDKIIAWLEKAAEKYSWRELILAGAAAQASGELGLTPGEIITGKWLRGLVMSACRAAQQHVGKSANS